MDLKPGGWYKVISSDDDLALDVHGSGELAERGAEVVLYEFHGGWNQTWKIVIKDGTSVVLRPRSQPEEGTHLVLQEAGDKVEINEYTQGTQQTWILESIDGLDLFLIINAQSKKVLQSNGKSCVPALADKDENNVAQKWKLEKLMGIPDEVDRLDFPENPKPNDNIPTPSELNYDAGPDSEPQERKRRGNQSGSEGSTLLGKDVHGTDDNESPVDTKSGRMTWKKIACFWCLLIAGGILTWALSKINEGKWKH